MVEADVGAECRVRRLGLARRSMPTTASTTSSLSPSRRSLRSALPCRSRAGPGQPGASGQRFASALNNGPPRRLQAPTSSRLGLIHPRGGRQAESPAAFTLRGAVAQASETARDQRECDVRKQAGSPVRPLVLRRDKHVPLVKALMGDNGRFCSVDKGLAGGARLANLPPTLACATSAPRSTRSRIGARAVGPIELKEAQEGQVGAPPNRQTPIRRCPWRRSSND